MTNVLIIDYDIQLREQTVHVFRERATSVDCVPDGNESLRLAGTKNYVLIFVNLLLPGLMNGYDVIAKLRQLSPNAHIVALSESNGHRTLGMVTKAGANELCIKPLSLDDLEKIAHKIFKSSSPKKEEKLLLKPKEANAHIRIFANIKPHEVESICALARRQVVLPGKIFELHSSNEMAVVLSGKAWYACGGVSMGSLETGEAIGEASLFLKSEEDHVFDLASKCEMELLIFSKSSLRDYLFHHRKALLLRIAANIILSLSQKLSKCRRQIMREAEDDLKVSIGEKTMTTGFHLKISNEHDWTS